MTRTFFSSTAGAATQATSTGPSGIASVDVSAIPGMGWTIVIEILGLDAGAEAQITYEDSVNAFSASVFGPAASASGKVGLGGTASTSYAGVTNTTPPVFGPDP